MKRIATAIIAGLIGFSFAGCGAATPANNPSTPVDVNSHQRVAIGNGGDDIEIYDTTLSDGTRCVITNGYKSGGVSCDWNAQ